QANDAALNYPRGDTTMPAHGLEGAGPQTLLQAGAGLAPAGGFQQRLADAKAPALEAEQVDAGDGDIAAQVAWCDVSIQQRGDHRQMLPLNQRHLARIAWPGARVIAGQPGFAPGLDGL